MTMMENTLRHQAVQLAHWAAQDHRLNVLSDEDLFHVLSTLSRSYGAHVILAFLPPVAHSRLAVRLVPELEAHLAVTSLKRKRDEDLVALEGMI